MSLRDGAERRLLQQMAMDAMTRKDPITGVLLGTLAGDTLGLPAEGMSARSISRRFGRIDSPRLLFGRGFVSDDTEQTALLAQCLVGSRSPSEVVASFRRALVGWFLRLPFGIGFGTLRACLKLVCGLKTSGVRSAGNGAAMRAAIIGAVVADNPETRRSLSRAIAQVTHLDDRAVEAAVLVSEIAGLAAPLPPDASRQAVVASAAEAVRNADLRAAVDRACRLAQSRVDVLEAARQLGTSGYALHSVPFAVFCFLRFDEGDPLKPIVEAISAGGDTDTNAAIAGALVGAMAGSEVFNTPWMMRVNDGPFGPSHLRALGAALNGNGEPPRYAWLAALFRNLALYPVILAHGLRRLLP